MSASSPPPLPVLLESGPGSSDGDEVIGSQTWLWCGGHAQISTQRSGPRAPTPAVPRSPCNGAAVSACCLIHAGCWPQGSVCMRMCLLPSPIYTAAISRSSCPQTCQREHGDNWVRTLSGALAVSQAPDRKAKKGRDENDSLTSLLDSARLPLHVASLSHQTLPPGRGDCGCGNPGPGEMLQAGRPAHSPQGVRTPDSLSTQQAVPHTLQGKKSICGQDEVVLNFSA